MSETVEDLRKEIVAYFQECEKDYTQRENDTENGPTTESTICAGMGAMCKVASIYVEDAFFRFKLRQEWKKQVNE